jgi:Na+/melibiose symporter-like transporter
MSQRWRAVGVLAGALFVVNVLARLVIKVGFDQNDSAADRVSLLMFLVIGVILAVVAFRWGRDRPVARWSADVVAAVAVALALTVFVAPLLVGQNPFAGGAGLFFAQIWLYLAATAAGVLVGYLLLTALGLDHRSQQLKRYAQLKAAKPRKVVRR